MNLVRSPNLWTFKTGSRAFAVALTFGFLASVIVGGVAPNLIIGAAAFVGVSAIYVWEQWRRRITPDDG